MINDFSINCSFAYLVVITEDKCKVKQKVHFEKLYLTLNL